MRWDEAGMLGTGWVSYLLIEEVDRALTQNCLYEWQQWVQAV